MKGQPIRLSSVYSLLILIPLLTACQSENKNADTSTWSEEKLGHSVQQAGSVDLSEPGTAKLEQQQESTSILTNEPPRLLGFAIGDPMKLVSDQYGKATEQYTMEDGSSIIVVHNYPGFTVGYNVQRSIHFIDVYSPEVDVSLNGVSVGSDIADVLNTLGEPSSKTSAVIMYEYVDTDTVLKLDVDDTSNKIVSIKLFSLDTP